MFDIANIVKGNDFYESGPRGYKVSSDKRMKTNRRGVLQIYLTNEILCRGKTGLRSVG